MDKQLWQRPVFFDRNRVYRVYLGGKLFHDFLGDAPEDGFYPEEWVASTVHAMNAVSKGPFEGISMIEGTDLPFTKLLEEHREDCLGRRSALRRFCTRLKKGRLFLPSRLCSRGSHCRRRAGASDLPWRHRAIRTIKS